MWCVFVQGKETANTLALSVPGPLEESHGRAIADSVASQAREGEEGLQPQEAEESLLDLISGYGREAESKGEAKGTREEASKAGKGAAKVSKSRVP